MQYETPRNIATVLLRHAPKRFSRVLEPSVGNGALLAPLLSRILTNQASVVAIDIDHSSLPEVKAQLPGVRLNLIHGEFLDWSALHKSPRYDLIVTNPPFGAKKTSFVRVDVAAEGITSGTRWRSVPIEIAFLLRCVRLLRPHGRLLAVVPSSVVAADRTSWLRQHLLRVGSIRYVHELPRGSFPTLEARTYLFVFDKVEDKRCIHLQNHDLTRPANLVLPRMDACDGRRLDYANLQARSVVDVLKTKRPYDWKRLGELVSILRGQIVTPCDKKGVVHSSLATECLWGAPAIRMSNRQKSDKAIRNGDLLVQRVGRHCSHTIGAAVGLNGVGCTDCVLILRPFDFTQSLSILFSLRVLLHSEEIRGTIEKGTGAAYVSSQSLQSFEVPYPLEIYFQREFASYCLAARKHDRCDMVAIEQRVWASIAKGS